MILLNMTKTTSRWRQMTVLMNESFIRSFTRFIQTGWFIQKRGEWLSLWTGHWIIDSLEFIQTAESFKNAASDCRYERATESLTHSIHSNGWIIQKTRRVTVLMNGPLNHWLTRFVQTADSFRNEASDCPYEWATESLTHSIRFKRLIHSETRRVTVLMNGPLNHWLTRFVQNGWFIQKTRRVTVLMNGPLNHWLTRFIQTADSFRNEASDCPYERATESWLTRFIQTGWFIQKRGEWLSLWMGHWIIDSLDSFKRLIHSETRRVTVLMNGPLNHWLTRFVQNGWIIQKRGEWLSLWMGHWIIDPLDSFKRLIHSETRRVTVLMNGPTESLTHSIHSNGWFIQKRGEWLSLWMGHWIIDSLDSFKRLNHSETRRVTVLMNGPLNHWLTRFIQTADSFRNEASDCPYEWATESLTHSIHSNGWFIQKRGEWLSLWMATESLTHSIHSNGWIIQKRNTAVCCSETQQFGYGFDRNYFRQWIGAKTVNILSKI